MAARTKIFESAEAAADAALVESRAHPELDVGTRQLLAEFRPVVEQRIDDVSSVGIKLEIIGKLPTNVCVYCIEDKN